MNKDVIIKQIPIEQMSTLDRQVRYKAVFEYISSHFWPRAAVALRGPRSR